MTSIVSVGSRNPLALEGISVSQQERASIAWRLYLTAKFTEAQQQGTFEVSRGGTISVLLSELPRGGSEISMGACPGNPMESEAVLSEVFALGGLKLKDIRANRGRMPYGVKCDQAVLHGYYLDIEPLEGAKAVA